MKKAGNLLETILDLGEELLKAGAEVWRTEELLGELFETYCFKKYALSMTSTGIQATVHTWDNRIYTQIRSIKGRHYDLSKLEKLYALVNRVNETPTGVDTIRSLLDEVIETPGVSNVETYIGNSVGAAGLAVLFGAGISDCFVAILIAVIVTYLDIKLRRHMNNLLAFNTVAALVMEAVIIAGIPIGITHNPDSVTIAGIFLLISGLSIASGIGDFMHDNALSGISETVSAVLGALGIAIGISLAVLPFRNAIVEVLEIHDFASVSDPVIAAISCTVGCTGFAFVMGAKGRALLFSGIGAALVQTTALVVSTMSDGNFFITAMQGTFVLALYAMIVSRITGIPGAVFRLSCVLPLLPGSNLYYTVLGAISSDSQLFWEQGEKMLIIAGGIAMGFIAVDVTAKLIKTVLINRRSGR